ncbi:MAG: hypothetical protein P4N41_18050 [Negativicutes bacterium]|nr:hypothetical protein [Negativicutes bacterium]
MAWIEVKPVIDHSVRNLCTTPYPGHPRGCPNYGKKIGCPPETHLFDQVYDLNQPVFAVYNVFDMAEHIRRMKVAHPAWSDRQLRCCLYWQGGARVKLREAIPYFLREYPGYNIARTPEAMGVNIDATMAAAEIKLEWSPTTKAYQIILAAKAIPRTREGVE